MSLAEYSSVRPVLGRASYWAESALATILEPEEQLVFLTKFQRILNEGIFDCDLVLRALKTFSRFLFRRARPALAHHPIQRGTWASFPQRNDSSRAATQRRVAQTHRHR